MHQGDEEGRADDRPEDGKRMPIHGNDEELREAKLVREKRTEQCSDEAERDGNEKTSARSAGDRSADRTADACDDE